MGTAHCEEVWEERKKSYETYIDLLIVKEAKRSTNIAAWNGIRAYDMYEPEWVCDSEKRVGPEEINIGDGPKFVCAPDTLKHEKDCLVYSIGSSYDFSFEDGIRKHAPNCEFHTFDGTMDLTNRALPGNLEEKSIHFHNWNVDTASGTSNNGWVRKTIQEIVSELGHTGKTIQVFKIDCEGCEYGVMPHVIDMVKNGQLAIEQIQIEMHGTDAAKIQIFFQTMRSAGYAIFHKERNHWGCNGYDCVEYAFISIPVARKVFINNHCLYDNGQRYLGTDSQPVLSQVSCTSEKDPNFIRAMHDAPCNRLGYSQGNQDCMLDIIFDHIGRTNRYFVEYGFNTPKQCSGSGPNTCKLWRDGWMGLLLDGENHNASINLHNHYLYGDNIENLLREYNVPKNLDFLSSDMDSHDFFVLSSILRSYQPRVVTTEYNANWPLEWTISQLDPSLSDNLWEISRNSFKFRQCIWGASASALRGLMEKHDYVLIGVTPKLDLFWARKDLMGCYSIPDFSYFVDRMNLGNLLHQKQSNHDYSDWLIDTSVWLSSGDLDKAREAARTQIRAMIESKDPIPCFKDLKAEE
ncbi:hypothetical protein M9434_003391 [Picochlorum sp. BPE23]|nr:hypothetical protein M9434_003391 [Picochlorum sp. BPE23]